MKVASTGPLPLVLTDLTLLSILIFKLASGFSTEPALTSTDFKLKLYQVNAITAGTDAQGEVTVRLEDDDLSSQAKGSDPDIIVASAKAYISALNRLIFKKTKSIVKKSAEFKIEGV